MIVKNISANSIKINKAVQIDLNTTSADDGLVLAGQTIDLSISISRIEIEESEQIKEALLAGSLVLVVSGIEETKEHSLEIFGNPSIWRKTFDEEESRAFLYAGIASGFIYAKNCLIG